MSRKLGLSDKGGHCCICGMLTIHGLNIMDKLICPQCEAQLTAMDISATEYDFAKTKMRELWDGKLPSKGKGLWLRS